MLINKSIKKFILLSLLLTLPAQTMSISWPSFSNMEEIFEKNKTLAMVAVYSCTGLSALCFKIRKNIAAVALGGCAAICLGILLYNRKKAARRIAEEREAEEAREPAEQPRQLEEAVAAEETRIVEEERKVKIAEARRREQANSVADRRCLICLLDKDETEERLLQEVKCPSDNIHPGKIHQSCLDQALSLGKCPLCHFSILPQLRNLLRRVCVNSPPLYNLLQHVNNPQLYYNSLRLFIEEEEEDQRLFEEMSRREEEESQRLHERGKRREEEFKRLLLGAPRRSRLAEA